MVQILHSCASQSFSGLERYVLDLLEWQKSQGYSVELFCRAESELSRRAALLGVKLWTIPWTARRGPRLWLSLHKDWISRLKSQIQAGPLVVHLHHSGEMKFHGFWLSGLASGGLRPHRVILQNHLWVSHQKKNFYHRFLYNKCIDKIIVASESQKESLLRCLVVEKEKFQVIPYGRDTSSLFRLSGQDSRRVLRQKLGLGSSIPILICVARLDSTKGVSTLIQAFQRVKKRLPSWVLVIVGDGDRSQLNGVVDTKNISQFPLVNQQAGVYWLGYLETGVEEAIAGSDVYVLPSLEECYSLALVDARILGLTCLGTTRGGTPSILVAQKYQGPVLFEPKDVHGLEALLLKVCLDPKLPVPKEPDQDFAQRHDRRHVFQEILGVYTDHG